MPRNYSIGDSFLGTTSPRHPPHLYVIISAPDAQGMVVVVNLTSKTLNDRSCILTPGDHPFVTKETAIAYIFADSLSLDQIHAAVSHGIWEQREKFRPEVLRRIQDGAMVSDDIRTKFREPVRSSLVSKE